MSTLNAEKFKPTLFLGLGGNGGKIVNILAHRLRRHPHWSRVASLTHFVAIDTNKDDLDKLRSIPNETRFLVSSFDARSYVERKRGLRELDEDPLLTQWIPDDYIFRTTQGAGAGQIRLESRLRLYYNLEEDRAGIRQQLRRILHEATTRDNPWRDNEDKVVRVILFGSVAGGTGSGGFLPVSYLVRDMILDAGWGRPSLTAILSLPTTFLDKVKPHLHNDIKANGYAALKELEFLTRQLDYSGGAERLPFHYDPGALDERRRFVTERPFNLVYLIDRPDGVSIEKYEHAVADASFLQMFSPLLGHQAGEYDNYEKRQKSLALGHFSVHYAAFGTALLHLPRRDILHYAGLRYVSRALRAFLSFGGDDPDFRVPYGEPGFERLAPEEKNKRIDDRFKAYIAAKAGEENQHDERGVFTSIQEQKGLGGKGLREAFAEKLESVFRLLDEELDEIGDVQAQSINPGNPSISRASTVLREDYAKVLSRVRTQHLESQLSELRTGRFFRSFFEEHRVNPIAQRLFLIDLFSEGFISPFADSQDGGYLQETAAPPNLDSQEVRQELDRLNSALSATATQGALKRIFDSENKAFQAAKLRATRKLEELAQDMRDEIQRFFWRSFEAELRKVGEALLQAFRKVSELADQSARSVEAETERFRADPASFPDSDVAQFYLDVEVLRDDRRKERLWNLLFEHLLDRGAYFDTQRIFGLITEAFQPQRDQDGQLRAPDASEILGRVRSQLLETASEVYEEALREEGMNLAYALDLEQRYIALLDDGVDFAALRSQGKLDEAIRAVPKERVRKGLEDRLQRLAQECVLLAHLDSTKQDDPSVTPASVFYAGISDRFHTDEEGSLGSVLGSVVSGVTFVEGWDSQDSLVLYRATLGIPIYWFRNVQTELRHAYQRVLDDPNRAYPLHIEATWEAGGLPNLDPEEMKRDEERRQEEAAARKRREQQKLRLQDFSLCNLFGSVLRDEGGYAWSFGEVRQSLGPDRAAAFHAFDALDPTAKDALVQAARSSWEGRLGSKAERQRLSEELQAFRSQLQNLYMRAVSEEKEREKRLLDEELKTVASLQRQVEAKA